MSSCKLKQQNYRRLCTHNILADIEFALYEIQKWVLDLKKVNRHLSLY